MYKPIQCTNEQLIPTRWIIRGIDRKTLALHVQQLKSLYGKQTARECLWRCRWIGIMPTNRARWDH